MSHRTFYRGLKNINADRELLEYVNNYDKDIDRKTGARALESLVIKHIEAGIPDKTIVELFKILGDVIPRVAGDSLQQNIFAKIRAQVNISYYDNDKIRSKSMTIMRFSQEKWKKYRIDYMKKVSDNNENPTEFEFKKILTVVENARKSYDVDAKLVLLELCSGSRSGELIHYSDFQEVENRPNYVKQINVLKGKDEAEIREIIKPILFIPVPEFIQKFRDVRRELTASEASNPAVYYSMNKKSNELLGIPTHTLRKLYAQLAYDTYAKNEKQTAFTSRVLGHGENSITVSLSYMTVHVNGVDKSLVKELPVIEDDKENIEIPYNAVNKRDGKSQERLHRTIEALKANNVKVTLRVLKGYGYGSGSVATYYARQKKQETGQDIEQKNPIKE